MKINSCFLSFSQAVEVINEEVILRKKKGFCKHSIYCLQKNESADQFLGYFNFLHIYLRDIT